MKTSGPPAEMRRRWQRFTLAGYRLGLLAAVFACLHFTTARREAGKSGELESSPEILAQIRSFLPAAVALGPAVGEDALSPVLDAAGEEIGWAAQTDPASRGITGYTGPSNLLVVLDAERRVAGTGLLASTDTAGHVAKITDSPEFFKQWNGRDQVSLGAPESPQVVSGASLSSEAMARGVAARFGAVGMADWFPEELAVEEVRPWFPQVKSLAGEVVLDATGKRLGLVLRSSRMEVAVRGFQGNADVLVALDALGQTVLGVALHGSRDNEPYLTDVRDGLKYDAPFSGVKVDDVLAADSGTLLMVSGASRTAGAVEETVREMLRRHFAPVRERKPWLGLGEIFALVWIVGGLLVGLTSLRGRKGVRVGWAVVSVGVGGLWLGLMTGQDQWIKWGQRGSVSGTAIPLLVLTAAAVLLPAIFGKNVYCNQLCPHGAAQQLVGHLRKRRFALSARASRFASSVPWLTLGLLWLLAFLGIGFPFSHAEPFEIWSAGFIALLPVVIFFGGLAAAVFLPQGYCHYACPTGAVLKFLASSPGRWTRRDGIAGGLVGLGWLVYFLS